MDRLSGQAVDFTQEELEHEIAASEEYLERLHVEVERRFNALAALRDRRSRPAA